VATFVLAPQSAVAKATPSAAVADCTFPESDADALVILNSVLINRYVWDHTHLTAAVQAAPNVSAEHVAAARAAITSWGEVLSDCFGGQVTLTDVTDQPRRTVDIIVHYVPHAGGAVFAGMAVCGAAGKCSNVLVSTEFGAPTNEGYTPQYLYYVTLHELGHALGLGHATNILESTDLMGYGWIGDAPDPVFSQCDVDALAYLFGPVLAGEPSPKPGPSTLQPTFDCG
jgi:predicted Zn-dependent protease